MQALEYNAMDPGHGFCIKTPKVVPFAFHIKHAHVIKDDDLNSSLYGNVGHSHDPTGLLGFPHSFLWMLAPPIANPTH